MQQLISYIRHQIAPLYDDVQECQAITRAICCDLLGFSSTTYFLKPSVTLTSEQQEQLNEIIHRLLQHEPLQYIEGSTPFCGLTFKVSPDVLIPRPETAELIEWIVSDVSMKGQQSTTILDMGTGSGCIAICLKHQLPQAIVEACDISHEALQIAKENSSINQTKVHFFEYDLLDAAPSLPRTYDIWVSNPPYICNHEAASMTEEVKVWEPQQALFVPDNDPLRFYKAIAEKGLTSALHPGGYIYVEINQAFGFETAELFSVLGYEHVELRKDIYGNDRMIKCQKPLHA